ncbi:hypothetical protein [Phenylobacterium sp.]|uniref:hypothetical protein n=1 Tax=Phenylobacterium sp. TaxID=1871053 RepID=UPI003BA8628A
MSMRMIGAASAACGGAEARGGARAGAWAKVGAAAGGGAGVVGRSGSAPETVSVGPPAAARGVGPGDTTLVECGAPRAVRPGLAGSA